VWRRLSTTRWCVRSSAIRPRTTSTWCRSATWRRYWRPLLPASLRPAPRRYCLPVRRRPPRQPRRRLYRSVQRPLLCHRWGPIARWASIWSSYWTRPGVGRTPRNNSTRWNSFWSAWSARWTLTAIRCASDWSRSPTSRLSFSTSDSTSEMPMEWFLPSGSSRSWVVEQTLHPVCMTIALLVTSNYLLYKPRYKDIRLLTEHKNKKPNVWQFVRMSCISTVVSVKNLCKSRAIYPIPSKYAITTAWAEAQGSINGSMF